MWYNTLEYKGVVFLNSEKGFLGTEKIGKLLLKLSIPATIGMMVNALYNLVDTIFVTRGAGLDALGGLTISFPIQMTMMAISMMFGVGSASIISRALGAGDEEKAEKTIETAFIVLLIIAVLAAIIGNIFLDPLLKIFGATENLLPYARSYISIILIGNIVFSLVMASNNVLRAEGNAKTAMVVMIIGIGVNIVLDPIFIFDWGLGMGVAGAALATVIGQIASFVYIIYKVASTNTVLRISFKKIVVDMKLLLEILAIGFPSFIRNFAASFVAIIVLNSLKTYGGDLAISVYGSINRVVMFIFMPSFGVVQGLQPIIGFNYGAKKMDRVLDIIHLGMKVITIYFIVGWAIIMLFPGGILRLFVDKGLDGYVDFMAMGKVALRFLMLVIPIVSYQIVASTIYQALGKPVQAFIISTSRQILFLIPILLVMPFITKNIFGIDPLIGIWLSFPLADFLSSILSYFMYKHELKLLKKIGDEFDGVETVTT